MSFQITELIKGVEKRLKKPFLNKFSPFDINWLKEKRLKHSITSKVQSHLYRGKYRIFFKDPKSFLHTVDELFIDQIYKFRTNNPSPYIIDCGAYIGTSILYFKTNYPNSKILAFEPDKENFDLLNKNINNWKVEDVNIINKAIWINNEIISFEEKGEMSGKIQTSNQSSNFKQVKAQRLFDLLDKKIDFLKIDIESAEYEVLKDSSSRLNNVQNLFIEYHGMYNEMYKLNDILKILESCNFYFYIKEAGETYKMPFWEESTIYDFDVQLNIFAFRDSK